ncbi:MAG: protein of unknown function containing DUF4415 domain [Rhodobacteraceae bacterium HLUCCA12]|nr:MAG: protein of unknown function containing DUF4415 domain [Rhodobacteraceae bacterium HLUCCA12]
MTVNKNYMNPDFEDDAPDLSTPEWQAKFARAEVRRGRPKSDKTKVSTTIRLSPEVIEHFKKDGPGWQSRIDRELRRIVGVD